MTYTTLKGSAGRLEGEHFSSEGMKQESIALLLSPHPRLGGSMSTPIIRQLFDVCRAQDISVLRFNYRGVGRSEGSFDNGVGEIGDAAAALDWMQNKHADHKKCWVLGYSFGAWVGMQLLMRRPEINHFVSVSLPANLYDFTFLSPCPSSGLIVHGGSDKVAKPASVRALIKQLKEQEGIDVVYKEIAGANHMFNKHTGAMIKTVDKYVNEAMQNAN